LSAVPVLFLDDWPVRSSFVSLLNKHFYAQISIQFWRYYTENLVENKRDLIFGWMD
jgi:hypothetical protein